MEQREDSIPLAKIAVDQEVIDRIDTAMRASDIVSLLKSGDSPSAQIKIDVLRQQARSKDVQSATGARLALEFLADRNVVNTEGFLHINATYPDVVSAQRTLTRWMQPQPVKQPPNILVKRENRELLVS